MRTKKKWFLIIPVVVLGMFVLLGASGCDTKPISSPALIAFVVGKGGSHGTDIKRIVLPNEKGKYYLDDETVHYVPGSPRNYIVNPPGEKDASNKVVGDRHTSSLGRTKDGIEVQGWWRMLWRLNQDYKALEQFYSLCFKYTCYNTKVEGGQPAGNFSTAGWNGMLSENHAQAGDEAFRIAVNEFDDSIWEKQTSMLYERLAKRMAEIWMKRIQAKTGFNTDLFCGSSSTWIGEGKSRHFQCNSVLFEVIAVEPKKKELKETADEQTKTEQEKALNQKRLEAARLIYGNQAEYWLGLQDTIKACGEARQTCVISVGNNSLSIPVPRGGAK